MLLFWGAIFLLAMFLLIKAADYFTDAAERVGLFFGLSPFIIGVTIVSIGTSVPELATGLIAVLGNGATEFVAANVIGSNIANMLLVVGISAVVGGVVFVKRNLISLDLPILAIATIFFATLVIWDGKVSFFDGIMLLITFVVYLWYAITHPPKEEREISMKKVGKKSLGRAPIILVLSTAIIYFASKYTVESIIQVADLLKLNLSSLVAIVVAIGTSLPELVVSIVAVKKKQYEVAMGNVFGSNIFNMLVIMGIPALFKDLLISSNMMIIGLPFLGFATLIYIIATIDRQIRNYEGAFFLLLYLSFIVTMFTVNI